MRKIGFLAGAMLLGALAATPAQAQAQFGAHAAFGTDTDFGIGARVGFGLGSKLTAKGFTALAMFDYFFPGNDLTYWEASANGIYNIKASGSASPYVGAGLALAHASFDNELCGELCDASSSDIGLNLLGGVKLKGSSSLQPFVEGRFAIRSGSQFVLAAGVYFGKL